MIAKRFLLGLFLTLVGAESCVVRSNVPTFFSFLQTTLAGATYEPTIRMAKCSLPAIERLANEGINFTDAHTSAAKCAPSRYSIITGNYQWRGRLAWGTWEYKGGSQITPGQETLADLLKRAGYTTAFVGKYHLGADFYKKGSDNFASESDRGYVG